MRFSLTPLPFPRHVQPEENFHEMVREVSPPIQNLVLTPVLSHVFGAVDKTNSILSTHGKIGNYIIIIIQSAPCTRGTA